MLGGGRSIVKVCGEVLGWVLGGLFCCGIIPRDSEFLLQFYELIILIEFFFQFEK